MIIKFDTLFAQEVLNGLLGKPKTLPSKYFYDAEGDQLFQQIMSMPEYYLTNSEAEIFQFQKDKMLDDFGKGPINVIELGAGDGSKTKILLEHFLHKKLPFKYLPIDISANILNELQQNLNSEFPQIEVQPLAGEYLEMLKTVPEIIQGKKLILFLGANIGNMPMTKALDFLKRINMTLNSGDLLLIGFDLKKNPQTILDAYNDPAKITARFNLNLLKRINRELQANFNLDYFQHWETYNPITGETKSHLVCNKKHNVELKALSKTISFEKWEAIQTELSLKYSIQEIANLAEASGFQLRKNYFDQKEYFTDSLWQKA